MLMLCSVFTSYLAWLQRVRLGLIPGFPCYTFHVAIPRSPLNSRGARTKAVFHPLNSGALHANCSSSSGLRTPKRKTNLSKPTKVPVSGTLPANRSSPFGLGTRHKDKPTTT